MSETPETDAALIARNSTVAVDADFAHKLERERDEARKERDAYESYWHEAQKNRDTWIDCLQEVKTERDELRAELERLKADKEKYNGAVLVELSELKADKARLDWLENLDCDSPFWGALCDTTDPRKFIDGAMKGDAK